MGRRAVIRRPSLGLALFFSVVVGSETEALAARPVVGIDRAIVLARQATSTLQVGQQGIVSSATFHGHAWAIGLVGGKTVTPCPTVAPPPQYPCDPVQLWNGAKVTIDARNGRTLAVSRVTFGGLVPIGGVSAVVALQTARTEERRLHRIVRLGAYASALRFGFLASFRLSTPCAASLCDSSQVYWDVTFSGLHIKAADHTVKAHFDVVLNAATGTIVLTASEK